MKRITLLLITVIFSVSMYSQQLGIKNNLVYDAALTPNLGLEIGLGKKHTLDVIGNYNPFELSNDKKWKHWLVQPEYRYWFCEKFNGTFFGIHALGGQYSLAKVHLPFGIMKQLRDYMYEGYFIGGGVSIGYQWILSDRWNLEASIGAGMIHAYYDKYPCAECGEKIRSDTYNSWGVTKATVSFIYFFY